ncbi:MAG: AAA family ATPase [Clostridiales Family XIII bacterium]|jgi:predicted AAA+ superfamily ATPase|nr:AAA family ATPase [Clostridiales Family XIII bacterium]
MLKRKAYHAIKRWKDTKTKQGLLVTGARQVGKTYIIREFARDHYARFAEINLIENRKAADTLSAADNAADLFMRISVLAESELVPGQTLIFIDEVQVCKEIVTSIKFLAEQTGFDFILSGSMLGVELKNIRSVPVGYLDTLVMYPLDFEEFCVANGVPGDALDAAKGSVRARTAVPDYIHEKLLSLFHEYLIIGGMPAAVDAFCASRNIGAVRGIQENLILLNKQDISKYNERDALVIKNIYDLIPPELNNQNKRFVLKDMNDHARYGRYRECFIWLAEAGVALPVYNASEPVYPLKLSQASNLFKLFMGDVGLLTSTFMKDTAIEILNRNPNVNYGSIYENAVAQELKASGFELYYYRNKKLGELDFLVETPDGTVLPVEVKSGKDYKRHNALANIISSGIYDLREGFVLCENNVERNGKITYLPVYAAAWLASLLPVR